MSVITARIQKKYESRGKTDKREKYKTNIIKLEIKKFDRRKNHHYRKIQDTSFLGEQLTKQCWQCDEYICNDNCLCNTCLGYLFNEVADNDN